MTKTGLLVSLLLSIAGLCHAEETCFPDANESSSPSGRMSFSWAAPDDEEMVYDLYLEPGHRRVLSFQGFACVHWDPTERFFAVTERVGSDLIEVWIYETGSDTPRRNIGEYFPAKLKSLLEESPKKIVNAEGWGADGVTVRAYGWTPSISAEGLSWEEFEERVVCRVRRSSIKCRAVAPR